MDDIRERLLDAILPHVAFEGWSEAAFRAAAAEAGIEPALARAACPRGAVDLAVAFHRRGDARMRELLAAMDLSGMRFRDRVAAAVRCRLEAAAGDREAVRRGAALFALPHLAPEGARLVWGTADAIWTALGDTSDDLNWYTKRATLSAVYAATVLYWLGDTSPDHAATWEFLDRRIADVMRIEEAKARLRANPTLARLTEGPARLAARIRRPPRMPDIPMPGSWGRR
ncbi:MAG: COQ9 family protein [Rhodobacteraceae bacterium]|nr:COQ9 family protein [Paracoccaceae bacterium]